MSEKTVVTVDFETRSEVNLKEAGVWRYAEDPSTSILCLGYAIDDDPPQLWAPPMRFPQVLMDHANRGEESVFEAHNVQFERAIWLNKLPDIPMPRFWHDTMATCAYKALPLGLDDVGTVLDLHEKKDRRGKWLINKLCVPQKKGEMWINDLDLLDELYDYCKQDVISERELRKTIGYMSGDEYKAWIFDQIINQRGVYFDLGAIIIALELIQEETHELTAELVDITNGEIQSHDQVTEIPKWLAKHDVPIPNLQANTIEEWLGKKWLEGAPRRVLEIRQTLAKASNKKLIAMRNAICSDHRIRGLLQYHGASTGRWAGRLVQPHNFPRGDKDILKVSGMEGLIELIKTGNAELIKMIHGENKLCDVMSSSLRGMIIASPGNDLYVGDFSTIEARQTMWVCNQEDAVKTFADYDKGIGQDIYCTMATEIFGYPVNKDQHPDQRQLGKITVLGCGYQMGADKLKFQALNQFGVDIDLEQAKRMVDSYRNKYTRVRNSWYRLQELVGSTILTGEDSSFNDKVFFSIVEDNAGQWLTFILPNGRRLWFKDPKCEIEKKFDRYGNERPWYNISYMGKDNKAQGRWTRIRSYGGMMLENIVQALARDTMYESMVNVEKHKYPVVLTVHDEIVCDVPKGHGSIEEFTNLMAVSPKWAPDCPITVEAWRGERYKK